VKFSAAITQIVTTALLLVLSGGAAAQHAYPEKTIRFITPYPPGGSTTILSRLVGQKLAESWGQQVIIDNRGGGNTIIGNDAMAKSPPDGYTILLVTSAIVALPHLYSTLPYDTMKDVAPVATISVSPQILVINPKVPANNLQEFIALAKSKPGDLNYATSGAGGPTHLSAVFFDIVAGTKMQHVPYKGAGPSITDLIAGQVQVFFPVPINAISHIKSGRLRALAITGESRLATLPQVPTFAEAGLPGFDMETWYGVAAPGATPKDIVNKLSAEIGKIVAMPEMREKLESQGMRPLISSADKFSALFKSEMVKYGQIIKTGNVKIE
jgi:tripartite-type tricarboxylate transporter receptor subunit TctC